MIPQMHVSILIFFFSQYRHGEPRVYAMKHRTKGLDDLTENSFYTNKKLKIYN